MKVIYTENKNPAPVRDIGKGSVDKTASTSSKSDPLCQDRERRISSYDNGQLKSDLASIASDSTNSTEGRRHRYHREKRKSENDLRKRSSLGMIDKDRFAEPVRLVQQLEFTAFKYIIAACSISFLLGKYGLSVILAIAFVIISGTAYWYIGTRPAKKDLEWQLDNEDEMESVRLFEKAVQKKEDKMVIVLTEIPILLFSYTHLKAKRWNG